MRKRAKHVVFADADGSQGQLSSMDASGRVVGLSTDGVVPSAEAPSTGARSRSIVSVRSMPQRDETPRVEAPRVKRHGRGRPSMKAWERAV